MQLSNISKLLLGVVFFASTLNCISQSLCDRKGPNAHNQLIRKKVYENLRFLSNKPENKGKSPYRQEYINVQTGFNALYTKMKDDLGLFNRKIKVCEKYSSELDQLVKTAQKLNDDLIAASGREKPASLGVSDILSIIEWIYKLGSTIDSSRKEKFYSDLEWADYDKVIAGTYTEAADPTGKQKTSPTKDSTTSDKGNGAPKKRDNK